MANRQSNAALGQQRALSQKFWVLHAKIDDSTCQMLLETQYAAYYAACQPQNYHNIQARLIQLRSIDV